MTSPQRPGAGPRLPSWDPMGEVEKATEELKQISSFSAKESERLVLTSIIAKGGFGTVHKGRWRNLDVAVKTVMFNRLDEERKHVVSEAALASSMSVHPNVVSTFYYEFKPIKSVQNSSEKALESLVIIEDHGQQEDMKLYLIQV